MVARNGIKLMLACAALLSIAVITAFVFFRTDGMPTALPDGPTPEELAETQLQADRLRLLTTPQMINMTDEAYAAEVARVAVESDTITIDAECVMNPLVIKMKEGSILKIDNKDTAEHVLAFEDQNFFSVSGGFMREINITEVFGKGEGIYRYRCGDRSLEQVVGIMYVVK